MTKQLTKKDKLLLTINWKTSFKENHTLNFIWINKFKFLQNAVPYRRDKSTDIFLYSYCFYKSIFLNSEPIQIIYKDFGFDEIERKISRWRASRRVRKRKEKKKRERMSKVKHVKFCCSRCCNSSSHGDLIRGGLQSHSEKFISISRSKTRACRVLFLPPPSLSLLFTRGSHPLCPFRVLSSTGTESEQEERAFISSLLTAMRRKHGRIFFSRSLFFFSPYSSADIYPFSISMTLNLSSR